VPKDADMTNSTDKHRKVSRTRKALGLMLAVWVSLAVQPCAVAAASTEECPHCPVLVETTPEPERNHCGSIVTSSEEIVSCASAQTECSDVEEGIVNLRIESPDLDEGHNVLPTSIPVSHPCLGPREESGNAAGPPEPSSGSVPLHVLKCLYLI